MLIVNPRFENILKQKDIQNLDEAIQKWKSVSENVLNDLFDHYKASVASSSSSSNPEDLNMTMTVFLERMKVRKERFCGRSFLKFPI